MISCLCTLNMSSYHCQIPKRTPSTIYWQSPCKKNSCNHASHSSVIFSEPTILHLDILQNSSMSVETKNVSSYSKMIRVLMVWSGYLNSNLNYSTWFQTKLFHIFFIEKICIYWPSGFYNSSLSTSLTSWSLLIFYQWYPSNIGHPTLIE